MGNPAEAAHTAYLTAVTSPWLVALKRDQLEPLAARAVGPCWASGPSAAG